MSPLLSTVIPLGLVIGFSVLLGLWLAQLKLAAASVTVSTLMVVLIVISVIELFGGRLA
jgi:hypothetical protein